MEFREKQANTYDVHAYYSRFRLYCYLVFNMLALFHTAKINVKVSHKNLNLVETSDKAPAAMVCLSVS